MDIQNSVGFLDIQKISINPYFWICIIRFLDIQYSTLCMDIQNSNYGYPKIE